MNFKNIRFKYTAAFFLIALVIVVTSLVSVSLIGNLKAANIEFSQKFNPAISAVINADRDLYQSRVAEITVLNQPESLSAEQEIYEENAQQAFDRMYVLIDLLADYPEVVDPLAGFDASFDEWKKVSSRVFALVAEDKLVQAMALSQGASQSAFYALREYYDRAGEAADRVGAEIGSAVISSVATREINGLIFLAVTLLLTVLLGFYAPKRMASSLSELVIQLKNFNNGEHDLSLRLKSARSDEIGLVANEFDTLLDGLADLMHEISQQANTVLENAVEMKAGAGGVFKSTEEQLELIEVLVTAVNEMSSTIREIADNAQLTATEVTEVNRLCDDGKEITTQAVEQIRGVATTVGNASQVMDELSESSENIASVLDVIRGIAEQTNLLALNAAIEAARAGEQGRGFAVVADEVRSLASKTQQSTNDIQTMIETLQGGVKGAVVAIRNGLESVHSSVASSESTLDALNNIIQATNKVSDASNQIATATEEQSYVAAEVNGNLTKLAELGRISYDHSSGNRNRGEVVRKVAQQLSAKVDKYQL